MAHTLTVYIDDSPAGEIAAATGEVARGVRGEAVVSFASLKREKLVLDWRKRQQSRAHVWGTIEGELDEPLPATYTPELFAKKCNVVYQHVYISYYGGGGRAHGGETRAHDQLIACGHRQRRWKPRWRSGAALVKSA